MNYGQGIKCAAYCRYSTYLQRDTSIEDQIRADQGLADSRKWELLKDHIYIDRCTSGTKNERKGLDDLLKMAKSGHAPFQYILVYDTSRFARTPHKALLEANELAFYGIYVYFVRQGIDTADKNSTAQLGLHGIIDHQYIEQLSDSTKRGVKGQILRGYSGGGSTFGYKSAPDFSSETRNGRPLGYKVEIEKVAARTVRVIFQLYGLIGWSIIGIVNYLNEEFQGKGIHKPLKGDRWRVSTISGILRNEKYIGISIWNKTSKLKNYVTGKEKVVTNPQDEWVQTESEELRIISNELWERVKFRLAEHNKKANHKYVETKKLYSKHLLTPVTKCGLCNNSFTIISGGKYAHYGCAANHHSGSSSCTNSHKINKFILERSVLATLSEKILNTESLTSLLEEIHRSLARYIFDDLNRDTKAKLADAEEENRNLLDAIKRGEKIGVKPETLLFELSQNDIMRKQLENLLTKEICTNADIEKLITDDDLRSYFEQTHAGLRDSAKSIQSLQDAVKRINVYPKGDDHLEVEIIENTDKVSSYIINLAAERAQTASSTRITTGT
jgi:DNA invertase Pin-like site-specific DNA recombinase